MRKITFIKPVFPKSSLIKEDIDAIYQSGIYANGGYFAKEFKEGIEDYVGHKTRASIVSSGTAGLMMAVNKLFDSSKGKVIIQSFTFAAGAHAILWSGFEPVFADISRKDWQIDIESVARYIKEKADDIAGIIVCNAFGTPCEDIEAWESLSKEHKIPLIIDSAAGFGSRYVNGDKMGSKGDCEIFSFHATKPFGIGEGGAVVSRNHNLIEELETMKNFSFNNENEVEGLGINAKLPEVSCAIGVRTLGGFDARLSKRRKIQKIFKDCFNQTVEFQAYSELSTLSFVPILVNQDKEKVMEKLTKNNIEVRSYYNPPLHQHSFFKKYESISNLKNTEEICDKIISLPLHEDFQEADIIRICEAIR